MNSTEARDRLLKRDTTLWPSPNVANTRLGWTDIHHRLRGDLDAIMEWAQSLTASKVVLVGMGGSSLGPEVLRAAVAPDPAAQRLFVLDTTDPRTIASIDLDDAVFIVSSKSGGTLEVVSLLAHFWSKVPDPSRYVAITDPGTGLDNLATERGFSRIFRNDPDIGGRYSVLSLFGLVPAAVLGYDLHRFTARPDAVDCTALVDLGLRIGQAAQAGRDKLTLRVPERFASLGLWLEQLIAESTGKKGQGVVPVPTLSDEQGSDRWDQIVPVDEPDDLAAAFYGWELATAAMGMQLEIDPFDEPNVSESKANTSAVLDKYVETGSLPELVTATPDTVMAWLRHRFAQGDYVTLQAYLPYGTEAQLESCRQRVRDELGGAPVTAGFGPRFLHSTGQLHKGGPNTAVAVQFVPASPTAELAVPGAPYDFATLISAQSIGDHRSLVVHGRRVLRVVVDADAADPFAGIA